MSKQATLIDGKDTAARLREAVTQTIRAKKLSPGLAVILVGTDPASQIYVRNKIAACDAVGIKSIEHNLPATTTQPDLLALITQLNKNDAIHGILLQLPLPAHLDANALIAAIDPAKDVDGLHPLNIGRLAAGLPGMVPCTPQGAMMLLKNTRADLSGLHAVVIGRSLLFGKPMAQLLLAENCTVTQAHSRTVDLPVLCRSADILVAAIGAPRFVKGEWIKPGAIVIDVGINRLDDGTICGDVDFEAALPVASSITPVPGGVGPMTIACLLVNTLKAAGN